MKETITKKVAPLIIIFLIAACSAPQSKEKYMKGYKNFIAEVQEKASTYTDEDWVEMDKKYEQYSNKWFSKFEDQLIWQEQLLVVKYRILYNTVKTQGEIESFYDLFIKDDLDTLKHQIKEYAENDMEDDIRFIVEQAKEVGEEALKALEEIMKEMELNIKDYD